MRAGIGPGLPPADECVLPRMLDGQAERFGDLTLVVFDHGPTWSYAETLRLTRGSAAALEALGIKRGEPVLVWLPIGPAIVRVAFSLSYLEPFMYPSTPRFVVEASSTSVKPRARLS